jgi:hypothetical protein
MRTIPLSGKHGAGKCIVVDDEDYDRVIQYRWHLSQRRKGFYTITARVGGVRCEIHQMLIQTGAQTIDHINRDRFDNRKCNLRPASFTQNQANRDRLPNNTSGYKGVSFYRDPTKGYCRSQIRYRYRKFHLGNFTCEIEAARNYDVFALLLFGEFAVLNFPDANYTDFVPKRLDLYRQLQEELNS